MLYSSVTLCGCVCVGVRVGVCVRVNMLSSSVGVGSQLLLQPSLPVNAFPPDVHLLRNSKSI